MVYKKIKLFYIFKTMRYKLIENILHLTLKFLFRVSISSL